MVCPFFTKKTNRGVTPLKRRIDAYFFEFIVRFCEKLRFFESWKNFAKCPGNDPINNVVLLFYYSEIKSPSPTIYDCAIIFENNSLKASRILVENWLKTGSSLSSLEFF